GRRRKNHREAFFKDPPGSIRGALSAAGRMRVRCRLSGRLEGKDCDDQRSDRETFGIFARHAGRKAPFAVDSARGSDSLSKELKGGFRGIAGPSGEPNSS